MTALTATLFGEQVRAAAAVRNDRLHALAERHGIDPHALEDRARRMARSSTLSHEEACAEVEKLVRSGQL